MRRSRAGFVVAVLLAAFPASAADWPQFGFDARKNGVNPLETTIHRNNVSTLHALYPAVTLPDVADGAPVFLEGVSTVTGVKDLVFVTTKAGVLRAIDAATGSTVWTKAAATGPQYTTSSPAIDPNRLYVYHYSLDGKVHKYAVADGAEVTSGGWPQVTTIKMSVEKCSSALATAVAADGTPWLYAAHGGYPGDAGDYQGHVTAIDLSTGLQKVFNANCSDQTSHLGTGVCAGFQTAIWGRPGVSYDANDDRIYMGTGNGTYNASTGGTFWGDSVFSLHADATGSGGRLPVDSYTPTEFGTLQSTDADLGSTTPVLLPVIPSANTPRMGVMVGKDGKVRLLNLANLSGAGGPAHVSGEIQKVNTPQGGGVLAQTAVWTDPVTGIVWIFIANGSGVAGMKVNVDGSGNATLVNGWTHTPGGTSPVVANGILYYAGSSALRAIDPTTGSALFTSPATGSYHWQSPIVVNGRVFVEDQSGKLNVFGPNAAPLKLYTVVPCRLVDTRNADGPAGGPILAPLATRVFAIAGSCGVPADALAIAANVTTAGSSAPGWLRVAPVGTALVTSNLNFNAGQVRADFSLLSLTGYPVGSIAVTNGSGGPAHVILDVSGYFK